MRSKQGILWAYNLALVALTAALAWHAPPWLAAGWPGAGVVLGFALFQLLVWAYGYPVPSMGIISMERVPQIAALLLFPVEVAAVVNALPALAWPFLSHRYRQGSLAFGAIRAVHNACMIALMTVAAGLVWRALGGSVPLQTLGIGEAMAILAAACVLQLVNMLMIGLFLRLDRRDVRRLLGPAYVVSDFLFVPIGVLAALVWTQADAATTGLFVAFLMLSVVSAHEIVESRRQVQTRLVALDAASSARQAVSGSRRVEDIAERLMSQISALVQYRIAYVALHDAERGEFDVVLQIVDGERMPRFRRPLGQGAAGYVLRTAAPLLVDDWATAPRELVEVAVLDPGERPGSVLIVPIRLRGEVLGLISVQHDRPHHYADADKHALIAIAEDIAPVIADARTFQELEDYRVRLEALVAERTAELERAGEERERLLAELRQQSELLQRQSREDALTTLSNRRHFDERIAEEIARARRYGHPLSLALIDIDHFKRLNDAGGHALGDEVLRRFGAMMRGHFRASDLVARIGGEEFAVLFPETAVDGALSSVEQLRTRVALDGPDELAAGHGITLSAGVAALRPDEDRDALMRRADALLYAAKGAGRNAVLAEPASNDGSEPASGAI